MKGTRLVGLVIGTLVISCAFCHTARANQAGAKCTLALDKHALPSEWTYEDGYMQQAKQKLIFGGKNTLLGFMELYNEPRDTMRDGGKFIVGMGRGIRNTIADTLGGALHLVTFPITAVDMPLPDGGTNVL